MNYPSFVTAVTTAESKVLLHSTYHRILSAKYVDLKAMCHACKVEAEPMEQFGCRQRNSNPIAKPKSWKILESTADDIGTRPNRN